MTERKSAHAVDDYMCGLTEEFFELDYNLPQRSRVVIKKAGVLRANIYV